jgi:hypothetical protein
MYRRSVSLKPKAGVARNQILIVIVILIVILIPCPREDNDYDYDYDYEQILTNNLLIQLTRALPATQLEPAGYNSRVAAFPPMGISRLVK